MKDVAIKDTEISKSLSKESKSLKNVYKIGNISTHILLGLSALIVVLILAIILVIIFIGGYERITWEFLTGAPEEGMTEGGIFPAIFGTVFLVIVMSIFGIPIGVITAIYLSEYSKKDSLFYRIVYFSINTIAGIPAILIGLFGFSFFIVFVGGGIDKLFYGGKLVWGKPAIIWAGITMAVLTLPVVIVSVKEALEAVPVSLREASFALGATKAETVFKVVLPRAMTGVFTGSILAVSRGSGEVAPILFTGAAYFLPYLPTSLNDQFMELGYHIYIMSTQSVDVDATLPIQFATTLVLLLLTFILNLLAIFLRRRLRKIQSM
ncbi:MAG: phosphate ABC transporter permease PstA [Spirochaetia bacterium]|nr:phosphate ABC transporter permease PstA [Spirochaetota bacterium]MDW8112681.1 phosphate ABC transporter permease PstA [Spirochaetia bacterium]